MLVLASVCGRFFFLVEPLCFIAYIEKKDHKTLQEIVFFFFSPLEKQVLVFKVA